MIINTAFQPDNNGDDGYEDPPVNPGNQPQYSTEYDEVTPVKSQSERPYEDLDKKNLEKDHQYQELGHAGRNMRK